MLAKLKKEIRNKVLSKRDGLSSDERIILSRNICRNLLNLEEFNRAKTVHFYITTRSEVITEDAVRQALLLGKDVVVPVMERTKRRIVLSKLSDYDEELEMMHHGIHEPKPEFIRHIELNEVDLMVLPGIAFDISGHRIGYGAGYYDRLLEGEEHKRPFLAALAYELQMVDIIPVGGHDVKVDVIITESRVIRCRKQKEPDFITRKKNESYS